MNKREFLQKLREYLSYELPARYIEKNIRYYDEYIDGETGLGRSAAEVIEELGDPQLIAKSIIDSIKSGADGIPNSEDDVDFTEEIYENGGPEANQRASRYKGGSHYDDGGQFASESRFGSDGTNEQADINNPFGGWHIYSAGGGGCMFLTILTCLIIFSLFSLLGAVLGAISPILAPIFMVLLILWLLGRRR